MSEMRRIDCCPSNSVTVFSCPNSCQGHRTEFVRLGMVEGFDVKFDEDEIRAVEFRRMRPLMHHKG